jgi:3-oxoacyl-[acyl-carrier-protein] synthase II
MSQRRVVVTGMGAVTPLGNTVSEFWNRLSAGECAIDRITKFEVDTYQCQIAAEVKNFDSSHVLDKKEQRKQETFIQFAAVAAEEAWQQAGLDDNPLPPEEVGTIIGSGIGGLEFTETQAQVLGNRGNRKINPLIIPRIICNMAAGFVAIKKNAQGPCSCPVTACATGNNAIGDGFVTIQRGLATAMIVGGAEASITPLGLAGFSNMTALSNRNDTPKASSIPFDIRRDGFVMGEGAGVLILEELESAKKRGATIFAEVLGYANTCDAHHITAPVEGGAGAARCMSLAVKDAGLNPEDIGYVNAHGTSTPLNDKTETAAIKGTFGDHAYKLCVSSNKSMIGHMIGAAGAAEAVASVLTLKNGLVPPTAGLDETDPECDLDYVPKTAQERDVKYALSNSNGFGGHNISVVFGRFDD